MSLGYTWKVFWWLQHTADSDVEEEDTDVDIEQNWFLITQVPILLSALRGARAWVKVVQLWATENQWAIKKTDRQANQNLF